KSAEAFGPSSGGSIVRRYLEQFCESGREWAARPPAFVIGREGVWKGMVELCTLASGSSGNCLAVGAAGRWVLVDAGISARRICAGLSELGAGPEDLAGIL